MLKENKMPRITINITDDEQKILKKRADKNFFSLIEQVEDIVRRSCISQKNKSKNRDFKCDDRLVSIFSKSNRGRKKKKK